MSKPYSRPRFEDDRVKSPSRVKAEFFFRTKAPRHFKNMGGGVKKNLNAANPPEQSKGLLIGGIKTLAVRTKTLNGIKRVPQRNHIGSTV